MTSGTTIKIGVVVFLLLVLCSGIWNPRRWAHYLGHFSRVVPMSLYGKVEGQSGEPLAGATVTIESVMLNHLFILGSDSVRAQRESVVKTDRNGNFDFKGPKGMSLKVRSISYPGLEFNNGKDSMGFYFDRVVAEPPRPTRSSPQDRIVFQLTKPLGELERRRARSRSTLR